MKKMIVACAMMTFAFGSQADPGVVEQTKDIGAAQLVYTNIVTLGGDTYKDVDKVTVLNDSAVTGTTVIYMVDQGVLTQIGTSGALTTGTSGVIYPRRSYTEAWSGFVVTGDVQVASTATTTKYEMYPAKSVWLITTLAGANGTAKTDALKYSVYSR